jgi:hypothetical protein
MGGKGSNPTHTEQAFSKNKKLQVDFFMDFSVLFGKKMCICKLIHKPCAKRPNMLTI